MSRPNPTGSECSHTRMNGCVNIPQELPDFLLQFTKDAIRAQPEDILEYSTVYFTAMEKGQSTLKAALSYACYILNCDPNCKPPDA
ncbi:unnamed protein product, partial [Coregonus sp. 'balchen']